MESIAADHGHVADIVLMHAVPELLDEGLEGIDVFGCGMRQAFPSMCGQKAMSSRLASGKYGGHIFFGQKSRESAFSRRKF